MSLLPVSVTLITFNESVRIADAIRSVKSFASEIIVIDSKSTDQTVAIAESLGAKVIVREFAGFGQQKNFAHQLASFEWVLNIDADERISPALENEFRDFFLKGDSAKFQSAFLPRKTWYLGRWIMHGGWYPNYLRRFSRKSSSQWTEPHLHESLEADGKHTYFKNPIEHYSFPTQRSHIVKNVEYASHACDALIARGRKVGVLDFTLRPIWKFIDGYFLKAGFLDGTSGFFIAIHSAYATFLRYTYLYEQTAQNSRSR